MKSKKHTHDFKEIEVEDKRSYEVYGKCKCGQIVKGEF